MEESSSRLLFDFYQKIDERVNYLKAETGLECPAGCGWCCETADPEITVFEALPLARLILMDENLSAEHDKHRRQPGRRCFFFDANRPFHCTIYAIRPLICRAFGYAGSRDKCGNSRFASCRKMTNSGLYSIADMNSVPVFQELQYELLSVAAPEMAKLRSFNDALAEAVEREMLRARLERQDDLLDVPTDSDPVQPNKPDAPCPAAA